MSRRSKSNKEGIMKKFLVLGLILSCLMFTSVAMAQVWYPTNRVTITWDAVTTLEDASPIPVGQTVTYTILTKFGTQDGAISEGSTIPGTQAVIGFSAPGRYYLGIKTNLMEGTTKLAESPVAWSYDVQAVQNGATFGVIFSRLPAAAKGIRMVQ
jgi:hypothetical protein